jgi:ligand-binding sensor domain-containing protein
MAGPVKGKNGTIWFGTMEAAIGFDGTSFTTIGRDEMGRKDDPRQMGIRAIYEDSKGNLWLCDNGAGVFLFDGDTTVNFTKLHKLEGQNSNGNTLLRSFSVAEDKVGNMWFGTVYSGIWRYDPTSGVFMNYTKDHGLKSDLIWTIYRSKQGELLFGGEDPGAVYKFNGISFDRVY